MSTEAVEQRMAHIRGVTVTVIASLSGVVAGTLSQAYAASAGDPIAYGILLALIVIQYPVYSVTGIVDEYSNRDYLFIAFMTFTLWFVTWAIFLTTETEIPI